MITQLTPSELQQHLSGTHGRPVILDVREPWERKLCSLPNSVHIPLGELRARSTELKKESEIVVICHHGFRSRQAAEYLEQMGFENLYNLGGGIDAWAREIDPSMARY